MFIYNNIISGREYLITEELHRFLSSSSTMLCRDGSSMLKHDVGGVYLVVVRVLNNNSNVLVYNYIYYPAVLVKPLLMFLSNKIDYNNSLLCSE
jgi:hypothetical protein